MVGTIIFIILLAIVGIIGAIASMNEDAALPLPIVVIVAFAAGIIGDIVSGSDSVHTYKVKELEKNTVFNITDSIGGFAAKDTVWVNYKTMMVDPRDSVAMQCVVVEEIIKK